MVKIRLKRMGMKKMPFYRLVVTDSRNPRDGRFIEEVGYYNPLTEPVELKINEERAKYWLGVGAQPPSASWGLMVVRGKKYLFSEPWLSIAPSVAIMIVVMAFNFLGDGLRDVLDPYLKEQ